LITIRLENWTPTDEVTGLYCSNESAKEGFKDRQTNTQLSNTELHLTYAYRWQSCTEECSQYHFFATLRTSVFARYYLLLSSRDEHIQVLIF
jgi:hypothetical protein